MAPYFPPKFRFSSITWEQIYSYSPALKSRVGIKPGFYHKAQPGGFYGFYEGGFLGFYGFYVGFINLKVYH